VSRERTPRRHQSVFRMPSRSRCRFRTSVSGMSATQAFSPEATRL
jgi:hypothetical protein